MPSSSEQLANYVRVKNYLKQTAETPLPGDPPDSIGSKYSPGVMVVAGRLMYSANLTINSSILIYLNPKLYSLYFPLYSHTVISSCFLGEEVNEIWSQAIIIQGKSPCGIDLYAESCPAAA